jgi:hypothetical protein
VGRVTLILCIALLAAASAAWATGAADDSVVGIAFHDRNGDGMGPQAGEEGLAGWVVWVDQNGDGIRDAGEPWATAGADGRYAIGVLPPGDYTLRIQQPNAAACPEGGGCSKQVTVVEGAPVTADFPIVAAGELPRQMLDPSPVHIGNVRLRVPRGCVRRPFVATLSGLGVTRVDFAVDRRLVRSVRRADRHGRWTARIYPRRLTKGRRHTVTASVWWSTASRTPGRRASVAFRTCRH